jgi:hypothetical protein
MKNPNICVVDKENPVCKRRCEAGKIRFSAGKFRPAGSLCKDNSNYPYFVEENKNFG